MEKSNMKVVNAEPQAEVQAEVKATTGINPTDAKPVEPQPKPEPSKREPMAYGEIVGMLNQTQEQLKKVMGERNKLYQQLEFISQDFSHKMMANAIALLPHLDRFSDKFKSNIITLIEDMMTPQEPTQDTEK